MEPEKQDYFKKIISSENLESPSFDFTSKVMERIYRPVRNEVFAYKPVISFRMWVLVCTLATVLVIFLMKNPVAGTGWLQNQYVEQSLNTLNSGISLVTKALDKMHSTAMVLLVTLASGWLLFFTDRLLKNRLTGN